MTFTCIFCEIIAGRQTAQKIFQDEYATAFHDLFPRTPVHILIVPNQHIDSVNQLTDAEKILTGHLILVAQKIAAEKGLTNSGYRLVINTGDNAGQSVHHLHLHLLGGKHMPMMGD
ncbi:MAG: HIT domain-containing protein [Leptolinea sp.]